MKKEKKQSEFVIEWQAPEFEYNQKDVSWYWLGLITGIVFVAFAVWQKNFLFVVFIVIAYLVIIYLASHFPNIWQFKINKEGIELSLANEKKEGKKFYPYNEIEGFDIHLGGEEYKELVLKMKSKLSPYLKINIHAADEGKIKNFLLQHLPKDEYQLSLVDSLSNLIKF